MPRPAKTKDWKLVTGRGLSQQIFNAYFLGWRTQASIGRERGGKNPSRHVSKYTTIFLKLRYIEQESRLDPDIKRHQPMGIGTIKPYLDYLKDQHPALAHPRISILLQVFTNRPEVRTIIVKDNRDIIQGINEFLLLYWHAKNTLRAIKATRAQNYSIRDLLNKVNTALAQTFVLVESYENDDGIWATSQERDAWWQEFTSTHLLDNSYIEAFEQIIKRQKGGRA